MMKSNIWFYILLVFCATILAVSFYFWEFYLLRHYLGGYDAFGLPIQQSNRGFAFFLSAWPVWVFPVVVLGIIMYFVYVNKRLSLEDAVQQSQKELKQIKEQNEALSLEASSVKNQLEKVKGYAHLQDQHRKLQQEYFALKKDYHRSLNFTEKLLEKIPSDFDSSEKS